MTAGKFNRRIRIEQRATAPLTGYGTRPNTWTTYWEGWAEVMEDLPSRNEQITQGLRNTERPARIRLREYFSGITSDMRVIYRDRGDRVMQITSQPTELGHKEGTEFTVTDFSTQGAVQ